MPQHHLDHLAEELAESFECGNRTHVAERLAGLPPVHAAYVALRITRDIVSVEHETTADDLAACLAARLDIRFSDEPEPYDHSAAKEDRRNAGQGE